MISESSLIARLRFLIHSALSALAFTTHDPPGALPQAFTSRAFGAEVLSKAMTAETLSTQRFRRGLNLEYRPKGTTELHLTTASLLR